MPSTRKAGLEARAVHGNWDTIDSGSKGELDYMLPHNLFWVLCDVMIDQQSRLFRNWLSGIRLVIPSKYQGPSLNVSATLKCLVSRHLILNTNKVLKTI